MNYANFKLFKECCKIPNHNDMEVLKEISEKNKADFKDNMFLMACVSLFISMKL